jgi:cytoskeletal protein CcmA (bactofilin family)
MVWDSRSERSPEQPVSAGQPAPQRPAPAATAPPTPAPPRSTASTFLDASSAVEGVIHSSEPLRLDGRVKGEIHCKDSVVIGESAHIEATIRADVVVVAGEVRGEVHAARKITLGATARMVGDLTTPAIVIEEGAELVGRIQIGARVPTSEQQPEKKAAPDDRSRDSRPATPATPPPPTA